VPVRDYELQGGYTLEAWVKGKMTHHEGILILDPLGGGNGRPSLSLDGGAIELRPKGTYVQGLMTPEILDPERWHHVAATYDGTEFVLYVNGEAVLRHAYSVGRMLVPADLAIGGGQIGIAIDEPRYWSYPRSQEEIRATMKRRLTGNEKGLVVGFGFDEGQGAIATDVSGRHVRGELAPGYREGPRWIDGAPLDPE
jgi:hypothetical protein